MKYALLFCISLSFTPAQAVTPPKRVIDVNGKHQPARVRIPLKLVTYEKVLIKSPRGPSTISYKPGRATNQTLRARINRPNHFFVGPYHISTKPIAWRHQTRYFKVELTFNRVYGAAGNLEESVGTMELSGNLTHQDQNIFNFVGNERALFSKRAGVPVLAVTAGYKAEEVKSEPVTVAKKITPQP